MRNKNVYRLTLTALLAALSYVVFTFLQIKVPLPGGDATSFHLGNTVCVLGGLLLGPLWGGIGGAVGMTIGDLLDPVYITTAPKTFILKFFMGLITGLVAHNLGKITRTGNRTSVFTWTVAASICGMLFNVIFDPLFGYFYKRAIMGKPAAEVALTWNIATTSVNAVLSVIAAVIIYTALRPALIKSGLFLKVGKETK